MLVAELGNLRVEAANAGRKRTYFCPNPECRNPVFLKRGLIKVAHFSHYPKQGCSWAEGETPAHREAKFLFQKEYISRGYRAEVEYIVHSLPNDRRADVVIWTPKGGRIALELQHTTIVLEHIIARARSYARENIAQVWIPFLNPKVWSRAKRVEDGSYFIERYSARPFERWIHELNFGCIWFYDPCGKHLWRGHLNDHRIHVPETLWYDEYGDENYGGGSSYVSKRWKELTLWGPYALSNMKIQPRLFQAPSDGPYKWPRCYVACILCAVLESQDVSESSS